RQIGTPEQAFDELRNEAIACLALPDLRPGRLLAARFPNSVIAFDGAYERYACVDEQGAIHVHGLADGRELARLPGLGPGALTYLLFSPNGRFLAGFTQGMQVHIWDWD